MPNEARHRPERVTKGLKLVSIWDLNPVRLGGKLVTYPLNLHSAVTTVAICTQGGGGEGEAGSPLNTWNLYT